MPKKSALLVLVFSCLGVACGESESRVAGDAKTKNAALVGGASARITITARRAGSEPVSCSYEVGSATSCALPQLVGEGWTVGASSSATAGAETVQVPSGPQDATSTPATSAFQVGAACNDGDSATTGDTIGSTGTCAGVMTVNCDDRNPLTVDSFLQDRGCVNTPVVDGTPCDDGDATTAPDVALNGRCAPGTTSTTKPLPPASTAAPTTSTTIPPSTTTTINYAGQNLRNRNFSNALLINANLAGADLRGVVLAGANLTGANLTGANFTGANLTGANLSGAIVTRANLFGANVSNVLSGRLVGVAAGMPSGFVIRNGYLVGTSVNLSGADLAGMNLSFLRLAGTNFKGANLRNANLSGSDLTNTNLRDANVAGARLPGGFDCRASGALNCP